MVEKENINDRLLRMRENKARNNNMNQEENLAIKKFNDKRFYEAQKEVFLTLYDANEEQFEQYFKLIQQKRVRNMISYCETMSIKERKEKEGKKLKQLI